MERTIPPWADPKAQPPPPPSSHYAVWSPMSPRRAMKPAAPMSSAIGPPTPSVQAYPPSPSASRKILTVRTTGDSQRNAFGASSLITCNAANVSSGTESVAKVNALEMSSGSRQGANKPTSLQGQKSSSDDLKSSKRMVSLKAAVTESKAEVAKVETSEQPQAQTVPWRKEDKPEETAPPWRDEKKPSEHKVSDEQKDLPKIQQDAPWRKSPQSSPKLPRKAVTSSTGVQTKPSPQKDPKNKTDQKPTKEEESTVAFVMSSSVTSTSVVNKSASTEIWQTVRTATPSVPKKAEQENTVNIVSAEKQPPVPPPPPPSETKEKKENHLPQPPKSADISKDKTVVDTTPSTRVDTLPAEPKQIDVEVIKKLAEDINQINSINGKTDEKETSAKTENIPEFKPSETIEEPKDKAVAPAGDKKPEENTQNTEFFESPIKPHVDSKAKDDATSSTNGEVEPNIPPSNSSVTLPDEATKSMASLPLRLASPPPPPPIPCGEEPVVGENMAEYTRQSVTKRIKAFEKQSSFEGEKPKEKQVAPPKPVAPWVKRTSSGPVSQEGWDITADERKWSEVPTRSLAERQPMKTQAPICASDSTGEYTHHYTEGMRDAPAVMPDVAVPSKDSASNDSSDSTMFDPWCDPNHPRVIQFQDVSAAAFKIKAGILNTPCTRSNISNTCKMDIFFKKEFNQFTGSFKERGARYTLLCLNPEQKKSGIIAASAGNHALALAYHGRDLGIPITVVMPLVAPIMKVQACRQYGASVIVKGNDIIECKQMALRMAKEKGFLYVNGYDHPDIIAGQGTLGLEIVEQVPNIDAVIIPVGGGGLIAGVALAVKALYPNVTVIGAESERCAAFTAALKEGSPVYTKAESTLADGLAVPLVGVNAFATASTLVDKVVVVKEEWIAIAILRLVEMEKAVVEGAGATGLAAILSGLLPELEGKRVVIPLCGGNIDTTILGRCLERGLAADGRLVKFSVTVSDRPGGIAELTRLLANLGVSIKDMLHERAWIKSDIFSVEVKVMCETRDYAHFLILKSALVENYGVLNFSVSDKET